MQNTSWIKTIDVNGREWARRSGGCYQSTQITINYGMPNEIKFFARFAGGSSDFYLQMAQMELDAIGGIVPMEYKGRALWAWCRETGIILRSSLVTGCKESEVLEWGTDERTFWEVKSPDGFCIDSEDYPTKKDAIKGFKKWAKQYEKQGYYSGTDFGQIELKRLAEFSSFRPFLKFGVAYDLVKKDGKRVSEQTVISYYSFEEALAYAYQLSEPNYLSAENARVVVVDSRVGKV